MARLNKKRRLYSKSEKREEILEIVKSKSTPETSNKAYYETKKKFALLEISTRYSVNKKKEEERVRYAVHADEKKLMRKLRYVSQASKEKEVRNLRYVSQVSKEKEARNLRYVSQAS